MRKLLLLAALLVAPSVVQAREEVDIHREHTFISFTTATITTSTNIVTLMNLSGSTVAIKVQSIRLMAAPDGAVTGLLANFKVRRISGSTACGVGCGRTNQVVRMDTGDPILNATSVQVTATPTSVSGSDGYIASATISGEETTSQDNPVSLYEFQNKGDTPLTLRAGQGIAVEQSALAVTAGIVGVQIVFTQELP